MELQWGNSEAEGVVENGVSMPYIVVSLEREDGKNFLRQADLNTEIKMNCILMFYFWRVEETNSLIDLIGSL